MPASIWSNDIQDAIDQAKEAQSAAVRGFADVPAPFPSPQDWRDTWIYFLFVDRFNNPDAGPHHAWNAAYGGFQGGSLNGVRARLDYLQELGVGAIWLSPVQKNCQYLESYHGYGIQDFVAIDPRLASDPEKARRDPGLVDRELRMLVDAAHERGIYVIFDIVLNHAGDVFEYVPEQGSPGGMAPWRDPAQHADPYPIRWRDGDGHGRPDWTEAPANPPADASIWPLELRQNRYFRRRGDAFSRPPAEQEFAGDFYSLKEFDTELRELTGLRGAYTPVRDTLIRAYQYLMAKFDVDGYRIDTLKYISPEFARIFGDAMREYALSIGKRNFFTFGEVYDDEEKIARFVGRHASEPGDTVGVDAALDFPLFYQLPAVAKGLNAPASVVDVFENRKRVRRGLLSSHGEASRYFVTFLDNHDQHHRFRYSDPGDPGRFDDQVTLAIGALFALQGIPCLYYGTEQGLHGVGDAPEAVREALWGKPGGFDRSHPFYLATQQLAALRRELPALRYGRQYFRPVSGDGVHFGISTLPAGVLAFSRILHDQEVLVVANTNAEQGWSGQVIVDFALNPSDAAYRVVYSNRGHAGDASQPRVAERSGGSVAVREVDGAVTSGPVRVIRVDLGRSEIQYLTK